MNKTLVCLTSTPSDELGSNNESEQILFSGEVITVYNVDKNEKTLEVLPRMNLKGRCSGILLSDNGKFLYTVMQKRKILSKFKLTEKPQKQQPIQKCDTGHQLDIHKIIKVFLFGSYRSTVDKREIRLQRKFF